MAKKILTGTEAPDYNLSETDRALTEQYLIDTGKVPNIQPEQPSKITIKEMGGDS